MNQKHRSRPSQEKAAPEIDHLGGLIDREFTQPPHLAQQARRIADRFFVTYPVACLVAELHFGSAGRIAR
jgi:hypothetical protein